MATRNALREEKGLSSPAAARGRQLKRSRRRGALVLLSGGIDSGVVSLIAARRCRRLLFLSFDYGQRNGCELEAARRIAARFESRGPHEILSLDFSLVARSGRSDLLGRDGGPGTPDCGVPGLYDYYVPGRNLIFLAHAAAVAEAADLDAIYMGSNFQDAQDPQGRGYPDSGEAFVHLAEKALNCGLKYSAGVAIEAPLLGMNKFEVIRYGHRRRFDFGITWSCYRNGPVACATCSACRARLLNFHWAGLIDPVRYPTGFDEAVSLALAMST